MTEQASPSCLFEAHLTVSDLSWAVTFYRDVVGLQSRTNWPNGARHSFGSGRR